MPEQSMKIVYSSGISNIVKKNSSFDSGILKVAYVGRNRNGSFISKETFERCIKTIYNCPIVCRYDRDSDTIGAHDMELVKDRDGEMTIVNVTHPVGVIPESAKYWFEEYEDDSGVHEYLCVEALIWKRQEAYKKLKEDIITDESMEIHVKDGEMVDGVYMINDFEFLAFCLLGTAEPCYESASLEIFSYADFKSLLNDMMQDLKSSFSAAPAIADDKHKDSCLEGGEKKLDEKMKLIEEFGFSVESLNFDINDLSVDEIKCRLEAMSSMDNNNGSNDTGKDNFELAEQFKGDLLDALRAETIKTDFCDSMPRYWYVDYDPSVSEVYCQDATDWNLYGLTYSMDGDVVVIDFDSKKRKKYSIVDFDNGSQSSVTETVFQYMVDVYKAQEEMFMNKISVAEKELSDAKDEIASLSEFKKNIESDVERNKRNSVFEKFEDDLSGIEDFESLRNNCGDMTVEEIEEKCYAIKGRYGVNAKFSRNNQNAHRIVVERHGRTDEPYGGVFAEYGISPSNQHN